MKEKKQGMLLRSAEDLVNAVERYGFLPFFQNEIRGFSVEELCAPELWFSDDADGPWEWKGPAARSGRCLYGKIFNKKAGFVSREWIPDFINYRRDGYDFDARWDEGLPVCFFRWIILSERQPDRRQPLPSGFAVLRLKALEDGR